MKPDHHKVTAMLFNLNINDLIMAIILEECWPVDEGYEENTEDNSEAESDSVAQLRQHDVRQTF